MKTDYTPTRTTPMKPRNVTQEFERQSEIAGLAADLMEMLPQKCPTCGQEVEK